MVLTLQFGIEEIQENISEQILNLKLDDIPGVIKMLPEEFRERTKDFVRDVYNELNWEDNIEYEDGERERIINRIITQIQVFKMLQNEKKQNETAPAA